MPGTVRRPDPARPGRAGSAEDGGAGDKGEEVGVEEAQRAVLAEPGVRRHPHSPVRPFQLRRHPLRRRAARWRRRRRACALPSGGAERGDDTGSAERAADGLARGGERAGEVESERERALGARAGAPRGEEGGEARADAGVSEQGAVGGVAGEAGEGVKDRVGREEDPRPAAPLDREPKGIDGARYGSGELRGGVAVAGGVRGGGDGGVGAGEVCQGHSSADAAGLAPLRLAAPRGGCGGVVGDGSPKGGEHVGAEEQIVALLRRAMASKACEAHAKMEEGGN
jgi:hypothetical protein